MNIEIEIKAWVDDFEKVNDLLKQQYKFIKEYDKRDTYFKGVDSLTNKEREIRIREEGKNSIVTYKERSHKGSVEVNKEHELTISDSESFTFILKELGYKSYVTKHKKGFKYKSNDLTLELSNIEGLGNFIEIEALRYDSSDFEVVRKELYEVLKSLDITESSVEKRYYVQMLLEKNREL